MITLLALPTIWLVNRSGDGPGSARPNVAAAGLDPGDADRSTVGAGPDEFDPMGGGGAAYLEPTVTVTAPTVPDVAIGSEPDRVVATAIATYSSGVSWDECKFNGVAIGDDITVVNVANGRSVDCEASYLSGHEPGTLVMYTTRFQSIADLVAAPIHVEIRQ